MNTKPLISFLQEELSSSDLAILINSLLDDYVDLIIDQQLLSDEKRLHINTSQFIHVLRRLRDVLLECR